MKLEEIFDKLKSTHGSFTLWDDRIEWYADHTDYIFKDGEDIDEVLYMYLHETIDEIKPLLESEWEILDKYFGAYLVGFTIKIK